MKNCHPRYCGILAKLHTVKKWDTKSPRSRYSPQRATQPSAHAWRNIRFSPFLLPCSPQYYIDYLRHAACRKKSAPAQLSCKLFAHQLKASIFYRLNMNDIG